MVTVLVGLYCIYGRVTLLEQRSLGAPMEMVTFYEMAPVFSWMGIAPLILI